MFTRSILLLCALCVPGLVFANVSVTPLFIDHSVAARDILSDTLTVSNNSALPTRVFASVNEITLGSDGTIETFVPPSMSDRTTSVTSWIAVDRGRLELAPGATLAVPINIKINPNVVPGVYFAYIGFASGSNRDEAEAKVLAGNSDGAIVRLEISDDRVKALQLTAFTIDRFISTFKPHSAVYSLTNPGGIPLTPVGEIIVYNARGEEVDSLSLNENAAQIAPGETKEFAVAVSPQGLFGKYKAFLTVRYGDGNQATVYDTAFFYAAPLSYLVGMFALLFFSVLGLLLLWRYKFAAHSLDDHHGHVSMYVRSGVVSNEQHHDIDLKKQITNEEV